MTKTTTASRPKFIITGGAGFIGSNLTLALQENSRTRTSTVIDDFRSGNFKNLAGIAEISSPKIWRRSIGEKSSVIRQLPDSNAIFHLASITDTTLHDQFVQVHDNVESFRRLLNFARPRQTRII